MNRNAITFDARISSLSMPPPYNHSQSQQPLSISLSIYVEQQHHHHHFHMQTYTLSKYKFYYFREMDYCKARKVEIFFYTCWGWKCFFKLHSWIFNKIWSSLERRWVPLILLFTYACMHVGVFENAKMWDSWIYSQILRSIKKKREKDNKEECNSMKRENS